MSAQSPAPTDGGAQENDHKTASCICDTGKCLGTSFCGVWHLFPLLPVLCLLIVLKGTVWLQLGVSTLTDNDSDLSAMHVLSGWLCALALATDGAAIVGHVLVFLLSPRARADVQVMETCCAKHLVGGHDDNPTTGEMGEHKLKITSRCVSCCRCLACCTETLLVATLALVTFVTFAISFVFCFLCFGLMALCEMLSVAVQTMEQILNDPDLCAVLSGNLTFIAKQYDDMFKHTDLLFGHEQFPDLLPFSANCTSMEDNLSHVDDLAEDGVDGAFHGFIGTLLICFAQALLLPSIAKFNQQFSDDHYYTSKKGKDYLLSSIRQRPIYDEVLEQAKNLSKAERQALVDAVSALKNEEAI